jgi:bacterioferritin (cytochrome b1)
MVKHLDKYIEIKNLINPKKTFERLENEFIDIMYADHISETGLIMLLDINIDPEKDIIWLKSLLDDILPKIGETEYFLTPFKPNN